MGAGVRFFSPAPLLPPPPATWKERRFSNAMDFIGVTPTIDQAIYVLLNSLAIVLWRIDSAIIGMSLIGAAGVSAVPMAARVVNKVGLEANHHNFLLMHAMGANTAGQLGSVVAGGVVLMLLSGAF